MKLRKDFPQNIRNIIFDFGGVIMDIDLMRTINAFRALGVTDLRVEETQAGSGTFFDLNEQGKISTEDFIKFLRARIPAGDTLPEEKIRNAWKALLGEFVPARIALIKTLRKDFRVFLLSNTNPPHREYFCGVFQKKFGYALDSLFDKAFYSDRLGFVKPDPQIYQAVIAQAGIVPAETLFIDDSEKNVAGAIACGLHAHRLRVGEETILDFFVDSNNG